ncbi:MAG: RagB/SusD family nutrient uptake outer membrane protein [Bacteroidales bacterium]|nr:RagB/SusD family nutrient uptake outer membrane protein [Bacteroidales bacterium]
MKKYKVLFIAAIVALCAGLSSCVGDLNVTPIDPNITLPEDVLSSEDAYAQVLAKCYAALATSSSEGPDADPDIDGVDGGFGQYMRALFYMNELPTDEAVICWNDKTVANMHNMCWTSSDVFVTAMFSRIYYQIGLCNEFIRRANASGFQSANMTQMIAEARALRALSYYHAIDMYGNVPFALDTDPVGSTGPDQISRADLFTWMVSEINDFMGDLKPIGQNVYGRVDQGFAKMILAKLYLNAEVYTGTAKWNELATVCKEIINAYPSLESNYTWLFLADNYRCSEIIYAVQSDATNTRSYGTTTFIIKCSIVSGNADWQDFMGVDDGWGGLMITPEFINKFDDGDARKLFFDGGDFVNDDTRHTFEIADYKSFTNGYTTYKFKNRTRDGGYGAAKNFPDTDLPVFRTADAYLMLAEAVLRGATTASSAEALTAYNAVHTRAGLSAVASIDLNDIIDERGRELYWECFRRSDLIRFNMLTTDTYIWSWKGGQQEGRSVDSHFNLLPIPASETNANSKLVQNAGY